MNVVRFSKLFSLICFYKYVVCYEIIKYYSSICESILSQLGYDHFDKDISSSYKDLFGIVKL